MKGMRGSVNTAVYLSVKYSFSWLDKTWRRFWGFWDEYKKYS